MGNVIEYVEAGDAFLKEEVRGVGIVFFEDSSEDVACVDHVFAGELDVGEGTLHEAFKGGGLLENGGAVDFEAFEFFFEEVFQFPAEGLELDTDVFEDFAAVGVAEDGVEEVFDAEVFVFAASGFFECGAEGGFEFFTNHGLFGLHGTA